MNRILLLLYSFLVLLTSALSLSGRTNDLWKDLDVKVEDIKMHYLEAGSGDRCLILIPGWTMPAEIWSEQIPYFAARGFRVIALDLRSQGRTSSTDEGNTYHQQAADLHAFLRRLNIEHSYFVGWASGVTVLLEYISSPETLRPEKLVFVDGSPSGLKLDECPGTVTLQQVRELVLGMQDDRAKAIDQYVRDLFKVSQPESTIEMLKKSSLNTPSGAALSLYMDFLTGDRRSALMHVSVPTLILSTSGHQAIGEYMRSKIPGADLKVIEEAGSAMFLDKPQTFNQALESFLGEH
jgi:pimeloyl-ACP methyl ester carboxylesterase